MSESNSSGQNTQDLSLAYLPIHTLVERVELKLTIERESEALEQLRTTEESLRADLVTKIALLAFHAANAKFRVHTRQIDTADLDIAFDQMKDAEIALQQCHADIAYQQDVLADLQRTYDDAALWTVQ